MPVASSDQRPSPRRRKSRLFLVDLLDSLSGVANLFPAKPSITINDEYEAICSWQELCERTSAKPRVTRQIHEVHWQIQWSQGLDEREHESISACAVHPSPTRCSHFLTVRTLLLFWPLCLEDPLVLLNTCMRWRGTPIEQLYIVITDMSALLSGLTVLENKKWSRTFENKLVLPDASGPTSSNVRLDFVDDLTPTLTRCCPLLFC